MYVRVCVESRERTGSSKVSVRLNKRKKDKDLFRVITRVYIDEMMQSC